jgi:peptide/nickel transport system substrate-binding protein
MRFGRRILTLLQASLLLAAPGTVLAQKSGGIVKMVHFDNPPTASLLEGATVSVVVPFMPVFNNLALYDQHVPQNSIDSIRPELATAWSWNDEKTRLTFTLREGVKWHDGKPFTSRDVKCTWDLLMGKGEQKLRANPREAWWSNVDRVETDGDFGAVFHLKRPQPALIAMIASGWSAVYPCHVPPAEMRSKPIGTGPFKIVEFRPNDSVTLTKNTDYWKPGLPYLDGIEYRIITNRSTRQLAFIAGEFDMTFPADITVPLLREINQQAPKAQCTMRPSNVSTNLLLNRDTPPFDNPDLRRAVALTIDRKAFIDILSEGRARIGGAMLPPPAGLWGLPPEQLQTLPGYGDVQKNREEARAIMRKLGYGPEKRMPIKVSTRTLQTFRDPAVIFLDQLKEIYIDAELDVIETSIYYAKVFRKDYLIAINQTGSAVDDPDQHFYENYACGSLRNYTNYCNKELETLFDRQSMEADPAKRRDLAWEIDRKLQEDIVRPIISHGDVAGCWQPHVKNVTLHVNSIYNNWRFEDLWLDR